MVSKRPSEAGVRPEIEQARVLSIDDEIWVGDQIRRFLSAAGFAVRWTGSSAEAFELIEQWQPQVAILDLYLPDLPGIGGLEICRRLRQRWPEVKVIMFSVSTEYVSRALAAGASTYLHKTIPLPMSELQTCIREVLGSPSRAGQPAGPTAEPTAELAGPQLRVGDLTIDQERRRVQVAGADVRLTAKEYAVLALLAANLGSILTYDVILERCWGPEWVSPEWRANLRQFMAELRARIEPDAVPRYLRSHLGLGYSLSGRPADPTEPGAHERGT